MTIILLALALASANVYTGEVQRIIDGDTIELRVEIWPSLHINAVIRILGIDTPELRGKCEEEKRRALDAKVFLTNALPRGSMVTVGKLKPDKYGGRYDADVQTSNGKSVAELLIAAGHARQYSGKMRVSWCGTE